MWKRTTTNEIKKDEIGNEESKQLSSIKNEASELSAIGKIKNYY